MNKKYVQDTKWQHPNTIENLQGIHVKRTCYTFIRRVPFIMYKFVEYDGKYQIHTYESHGFCCENCRNV